MAHSPLGRASGRIQCWSERLAGDARVEFVRFTQAGADLVRLSKVQSESYVRFVDLVKDAVLGGGRFTGRKQT